MASWCGAMLSPNMLSVLGVHHFMGARREGYIPLSVLLEPLVTSSGRFPWDDFDRSMCSYSLSSPQKSTEWALLLVLRWHSFWVHTGDTVILLPAKQSQKLLVKMESFEARNSPKNYCFVQDQDIAPAISLWSDLKLRAHVFGLGW